MKKYYISPIIVIVFILSGCLLFTPELKMGIKINEKNIQASDIANNIHWTYIIVPDSKRNKIFVSAADKLLIIDTLSGEEKLIAYELKGTDPDLLFIRNRLKIINTGFDSVGLMSEDGKLIWKYPIDIGELTPYDIKAWKLKSGEVEYYVATASKGVHALDENGKFLRQIGAGYFAHIQFCKFEKDYALIGHNYPNREFYIWDLKGDLKQRIVTKKNYTNFSIINWPGDNNILVDDGSSFYILDFNGNKLFEWKSDVSILDTRGTGVYLEKGKKYLAVITTSRLPYSLSILWIFSPTGEMIYKELICRTVALKAVKNGMSDREFLLVGDCKLKQYQLPFEK